MNDRAGVEFLQWCLPHLGLRWPGFRKVRRQIYKRIDRRLKDLAMPDVSAYRRHLCDYPDEWAVLDGLCRVFITRFYRDRAVFECLGREVLPALASRVAAAGERHLTAWSIGCASGEEPYTLAIVWHERCASMFPALRLGIVATDVDEDALARAERGCYLPSSLEELPPDLVASGFTRSGRELCVKPEYRSDTAFLRQDVRQDAPAGRFQLVLCRNVAFTYFDDAVQRDVLRRIAERVISGGALVLGSTESLPAGDADFAPWSGKLRVYRRKED